MCNRIPVTLKFQTINLVIYYRSNQLAIYLEVTAHTSRTIILFSSAATSTSEKFLL